MSSSGRHLIFYHEARKNPSHPLYPIYHYSNLPEQM